MADGYVRVSSLDDISVGDEVKITPDADTIKKSFPPGTNFATVSVAEMKKMAKPKKGTVTSKTDTGIVTDIAGGMEVKIPPAAGDMFKWTVFKKAKGGRRRKSTRRHKKSRQTRRR